MNSTFSCWSEGRVCWLVLTLSCKHLGKRVYSDTKKKCHHHTAGLESPTHALRADADPSAQSASSTYITLAQEHPYDRHIEIILHLSGKPCRTVPKTARHGSTLRYFHNTNDMTCSLTKPRQNLTVRSSSWREAGSRSASMKTSFVPAEILSAALGKIQTQKERWLLSQTFAVYFPSYSRH